MSIEEPTKIELSLEPLFKKAREEGLYFFINSMATGPLWFSPDELKACQKEGRFRWGAVNWTLRDPREHLDELARRGKDTHDAHQEFLLKLKEEGRV